PSRRGVADRVRQEIAAYAEQGVGVTLGGDGGQRVVAPEVDGLARRGRPRPRASLGDDRGEVGGPPLQGRQSAPTRLHQVAGEAREAVQRLAGAVQQPRDGFNLAPVEGARRQIKAALYDRDRGAELVGDDAEELVLLALEPLGLQRALAVARHAG